MKKKSDIQARLTVYRIGEMSTKQYNFFKKWIMMVAKELTTENRKVFNQKIFRHTLYKP